MVSLIFNCWSLSINWPTVQSTEWQLSTVLWKCLQIYIVISLKWFMASRDNIDTKNNTGPKNQVKEETFLLKQRFDCKETKQTVSFDTQHAKNMQGYSVLVGLISISDFTFSPSTSGWETAWHHGAVKSRCLTYSKDFEVTLTHFSTRAHCLQRTYYHSDCALRLEHLFSNLQIQTHRSKIDGSPGEFGGTVGATLG